MHETAHTIDPEHTALLVMDFQEGIVARLGDPRPTLDAAEQAIAWARGRGIHVGYVRVAFTDADYDAFPPASRMGERVRAAGDALRDDSPHTQIHERVGPEPGDTVVRKTRVGAFSTTGLHEQLRERGIDTLVLAGISTSGVVLSTVRDGHDRDYALYVLADASADPDAEVHDFLTTRVFPSQANVVTVGELEQLVVG
ncbi:MAG TPA: cysteine hydrolase [Thermoleophilaceae bacterium]|nr:cysteine hydrolase [Thermoleophilaceae bacterium]